MIHFAGTFVNKTNGSKSLLVMEEVISAPDRYEPFDSAGGAKNSVYRSPVITATKWNSRIKKLSFIIRWTAHKNSNFLSRV